MAETIFKTLADELNTLGLVDIPYLKERMAASIGGHVLNLHNLDTYDQHPERAFYDGGKLENFRCHMLMMAPAGFGKTLLFGLALSPTDGILRGCKYITTTIQSTFSPESWAGTATNDGGKVIQREGVFTTHKRGMLGADEFQHFVDMMQPPKKGADVTNEQTYMLKGLDENVMCKNLAISQIQMDGIGTTLWAGARIEKIDMRHGLARRVLLQLFFPTPEVCKGFKESFRSDKRKKMISKQSVQDMNSAIIDALQDMQSLTGFDYTELNNWIDQEYGRYNIPHFEEILIRRLAVGFSVARNTLPMILIDDEMKGLIRDELRNRIIARGNPEIEAMRAIIREAGEIEGSKLSHFLSSQYQYSEDRIRALLNQLALMKEVKYEVKDGEKIYSPMRTQKKEIRLDEFKVARKAA